jgi:hypothetical protein
MPTELNTPLDRLLAEAEAAPLADRIALRDPIAAHGADAIQALEPWLADRQLASFAVRAMTAAGVEERDLAIEALKRGYGSAPTTTIRGDIAEALTKLGVKSPAKTRKARVREPVAVYDAMDLEDLVPREFYERSRLHARGLGGNPQSGISYPAQGDYALLFTNPAREGETGYRDRRVSADEILFYGQWAGEGDMPFNATNQKFIERSPQLHLFTLGDHAYRYEGRFAYVDHEPERATNRGDPATAIVFRLKRAQ